MAAANHSFPLLLGLRLRFCLRGKYSDIFNFIFHINLVDLFWPVPAAATDGKLYTLTTILHDEILYNIINLLLFANLLQ